VVQVEKEALSSLGGVTSVETKSVQPCLKSSQLEYETPVSCSDMLSSLTNSLAAHLSSVANPGVGNNPVLSSGATNSPILTAINSPHSQVHPVVSIAVNTNIPVLPVGVVSTNITVLPAGVVSINITVLPAGVVSTNITVLPASAVSTNITVLLAGVVSINITVLPAGVVSSPDTVNLSLKTNQFHP